MEITERMRRIWKILRSDGINEYGTAGLMGNLYAESRCNTVCVEGLLIRRYKQDGYLSWPYGEYDQRTSDLYCKRVDSGEISRDEFLSPRQYTGKSYQYGWGLWQITSKSRKEGLYDLCKKKGVSIGDENVQVEYLLYELKNKYKTVYDSIKNANTIEYASTIVLKKFEIPSNPNVLVSQRAGYGRQIYTALHGSTSPATVSSNSSKINNTVKWEGYVSLSSLPVLTWTNSSSKPCSFSPLKSGIKVGVCDEINGSDGTKWYFIKHNSKFGFVKSNGVSKNASQPAATTTKPKTTTVTEQDIRNNVIAIAKSYLGCKESDGSHRKIIDGYNAHKPLRWGYKVTYTDAWCATFVSFVGIKAGLTDIMFTSCNCDDMISLYKSAGRWMENDAYVPNVADIIMYDWQDNGAGDNVGGADHVGLVVSCDGKNITAIEGNKNDSVAYRTIAVNGKFIRGYCLPNYASKAGGKKVETSESSDDSKLNETVRWYGTVTAESLNVRRWAGTSNEVCSFSPLSNGDRVGVCDSVKADDGSKWYFVKYNGLFGFVHSDYIEK